ncbi:LytR/AlgR family response regulator transcription factor [Lutispora saccharofermentans]|uniref:Stage 0 sporulation protein A homolog n=1 Tax=Lutispora saccharofermentans TaxID=3024236 RepID=A0ABT1NJ02_9FIRM|nr:LytTR family DNA-binding domain-containing protein [Lutispora saccharofermentans]MCQ1531255.1 LytTR family DNA-binding domain-containing protein [Lutispora saccharofermentans]
MLNFVICDDMEAKSIRTVIEPMIKELNLGRIVLSETKPDRILNYIKHNDTTSVYLIDIELDTSVNGIDIARLIRDRDASSYIVFITAHQEFAFLTYKYKLRVMDYLVKPLKPEDIRQCLESICELEKKRKAIEDDNHQKNNTLSIKSGCRQYRVNVEDIIYLEVIKNKIIIHTETGKISFICTLKDVRDKLSRMGNDIIMDCHKSYMVNINKVQGIDNMDIIMSNGDRCPLSRNHRKEIIDAFGS